MVLRYAGKRKIGNASGDYYTSSARGGAFKRFKRGLKIPAKYRGLNRFSGGMTQELKFFDNAVNFTADVTNEIPATGQLCTIAQGDGQSNREGRKIIIKSITCKGRLNQTPGAAATSADIFYMWLVQDTQCNGAAATVANDDTGIFTAAGADASVAVRCLANGERFKILKKWAIPISAQAGVTTAYNTMAKNIDYYTKCHIPIEYDASATTGALTTIRSNNIFLVAGAGQASDDLITCTMTVRLRFVG